MELELETHSRCSREEYHIVMRHKARSPDGCPSSTCSKTKRRGKLEQKTEELSVH